MTLLKGKQLFSLPTIDITFGTRMMKSRLLYAISLCFLAVLVFQAHTRVFAGGQKFPSAKAIVFTVYENATISKPEQHKSVNHSPYIFAESNCDDDDDFPHAGKKLITSRFVATTHNSLFATTAVHEYKKVADKNPTGNLSHYKYISQRTFRV